MIPGVLFLDPRPLTAPALCLLSFFKTCQVYTAQRGSSLAQRRAFELWRLGSLLKERTDSKRYIDINRAKQKIQVISLLRMSIPNINSVIFYKSPQGKHKKRFPKRPPSQAIPVLSSPSITKATTSHLQHPQRPAEVFGAAKTLPKKQENELFGLLRPRFLLNKSTKNDFFLKRCLWNQALPLKVLLFRLASSKASQKSPRKPSGPASLSQQSSWSKGFEERIRMLQCLPWVFA